MFENTQKPASPKQLNWLKSLLVERDTTDAVVWPQNWQPRLAEIRGAFVVCDLAGYEPSAVNAQLTATDAKIVTHTGFQFMLERLQRSPKVAPKANEVPIEGLQGAYVTVTNAMKMVSDAATKTPVTEAGMYKAGETIYKVQKAVHGSGNLYAKMLKVYGAGDDSNGATLTVSFVYAPGAMKKLTANDRLSMKEAQAFGALYGTCCCCGRLLTNELSIALGIGPVCGKREFGGEFLFMLEQAKTAAK